MPRKRFANEQVAFALRQAENGATVDEVRLDARAPPAGPSGSERSSSAGPRVA